MDERTTPAHFAEDGEDQISERTISRMRWYLYALEDYSKQGISTVASREIADKCGVKSGLVRKDLCHFGGFGRPSVGYNVAYLQKKIREILRLNEKRAVAWVGSRRLDCDQSLMEKFADRNYIIAAVFDFNPTMAGQRIGEQQVLHADDIEGAVSELGIESAVIATSEEDAQQAADKLIAGGVKVILNLAPTVVSAAPGIAVRNIDLAGELMMLSFRVHEADSAR